MTPKAVSAPKVQVTTAVAALVLTTAMGFGKVINDRMPPEERHLLSASAIMMDKNAPKEAKFEDTLGKLRMGKEIVLPAGTNLTSSTPDPNTVWANDGTTLRIGTRLAYAVSSEPDGDHYRRIEPGRPEPNMMVLVPFDQTLKGLGVGESKLLVAGARVTSPENDTIPGLREWKRDQVGGTLRLGATDNCLMFRVTQEPGGDRYTRIDPKAVSEPSGTGNRYTRVDPEKAASAAAQPSTQEGITSKTIMQAVLPLGILLLGVTGTALARRAKKLEPQLAPEKPQY